MAADFIDEFVIVVRIVEPRGEFQSIEIAVYAQLFGEVLIGGRRYLLESNDGLRSKECRPNSRIVLGSHRLALEVGGRGDDIELTRRTPIDGEVGDFHGIGPRLR